MYGGCLDERTLQYINEKYMCLSVIAYIFAIDLDASGYSDYQNVS